MSDDEADPELLDLLRQTLGLGRRPANDEVSNDTGVLKDAEYIYNNAIDVSIDMHGTKAAAASIHAAMRQRQYSTQAWGEHELHPTRDKDGFLDVEVVNFVFTMDLLNFSFWSELPDQHRFQVDYRGRRWTGYMSLVAALRRALDEDVPVTTPRFWCPAECTDEVLARVFRSATTEEIPLFGERVKMLREAGRVLQESFGDPEQDVNQDHMDADDHDAVSASQVDGAAERIPVTDSTATQTQPAAPLATVVPDENAADGDITGEQPLQDHAISAEEPSDTARVPSAITVDHETKPNGPASTNTSQISQTTESATDTTVTTMNRPRSQFPPSFTTNPTHTTPRDLSVVRLIEKADHSAGKLVNLLAKHFPCFRDETRFESRRVRLLKRAQIFVADLWAAFNGEGYGEFGDVGGLTMFADYRVPQMLHSLGVLVYSPPLDNAIRTHRQLEAGHSWEVQIRGCSIWAVELMRREIVRRRNENTSDGDATTATTEVNAVLIDFFLYDLAKEQEAAGLHARALPHHRTRSIWY